MALTVACSAPVAVATRGMAGVKQQARVTRRVQPAIEALHIAPRSG